jgi:hypothetical protein
MTQPARSTPPREPASDCRTPVQCPVTHKVLAYIEADALYFWCRACRCEHRIPVQELQILPNSAIL